MDGYKIINYDGKERKIRLGIMALRDFEKATGYNVVSLFANAKTVPLSIDTMVMLFYCGLKANDKRLTVEEVTIMVDKYMNMPDVTLETLTLDLIDALKEAGIFKDDDKENKEDKKEDGDPNA